SLFLLRAPPSSTLFPYTTLFRSTLHDLFGDWHDGVAEVVRAVAREGDVDRRTLYDAAPLSSMVRGNAAVIGDAAHAMAPNAGRRSEEHTSELQSRENLVCRLLLE